MDNYGSDIACPLPLSPIYMAAAEAVACHANGAVNLCCVN